MDEQYYYFINLYRVLLQAFDFLSIWNVQTLILFLELSNFTNTPEKYISRLNIIFSCFNLFVANYSPNSLRVTFYVNNISVVKSSVYSQTAANAPTDHIWIEKNHS